MCVAVDQYKYVDATDIPRKFLKLKLKCVSSIWKRGFVAGDALKRMTRKSKKVVISNVQKGAIH